MKTQILTAPDRYNSLKLAVNNIKAAGIKIEIELVKTEFPNQVLINIEIDDPAFLFYLGTITEANYQISNEKFFKNKMSNQ